MHCVPVKLSLKFSHFSHSLFVVVGTWLARMCLRDVATKSWAVLESFVANFALILQVRVLTIDLNGCSLIWFWATDFFIMRICCQKWLTTTISCNYLCWCGKSCFGLSEIVLNGQFLIYRILLQLFISIRRTVRIFIGQWPFDLPLSHWFGLLVLLNLLFRDLTRVLLCIFWLLCCLLRFPDFLSYSFLWIRWPCQILGPFLETCLSFLFWNSFWLLP